MSTTHDSLYESIKHWSAISSTTLGGFNNSSTKHWEVLTIHPFNFALNFRILKLNLTIIIITTI